MITCSFAKPKEDMHIAVHRTAGIIRTHEFKTRTRCCDAWRRWRRSTLRERYPLWEQVGAVRVPVAVVAGAADEVVPVAQSRAVAAAAGASYVELPGMRHNDIALVSGPAVVEAVVTVSDR